MELGYVIVYVPDVASDNLSVGYVKANETSRPLGVEVGLVSDDTEAAHRRAVAAGATELAPPKKKPRGPGRFLCPRAGWNAR